MNVSNVLSVVTALALAACVGGTAPAPAAGTTTLTAADVSAGASDRDAALSRARRRLEVAAREIGVLERQLSRHPPEAATSTRETLRRAERERARLDHEVSGLAKAPAASWSRERSEALETRLDELDALLELARR